MNFTDYLPSLFGLLSGLRLKKVAGPQGGKTENGEASNRDKYWCGPFVYANKCIL
jgi:hypothetical protein